MEDVDIENATLADVSAAEDVETDARAWPLLSASISPSASRHTRPGGRGRSALHEPVDMSRRSSRRKLGPSEQTRADLVYPRSLQVLEPGRTRRHPMPRVARMLWGVAIGFASAMSVAGLLAWLG